MDHYFNSIAKHLDDSGGGDQAQQQQVQQSQQQLQQQLQSQTNPTTNPTITNNCL